MPKRPGLAAKLALMWARGRKAPVPFEPLPPDTRARILVVNTTGIGDTIFSTTAIADLREAFAQASIFAFVDRRRLELVRNNPRLNGVVAYPGKFKQVRATLAALRAGAFDVAVIQHANDPDVVPMVAKAGAKALVGYKSHTFSELYAVALPPADRAGGAHTIDARLALTRAVGAKGSHWHTEMYPSEDDRAAATALLAAKKLRAGQAVALNLGGALASKRWPLDNWRALAQKLDERGISTLLLGGPADRAAAAAITAVLPHSGRCVNATGDLGFMACTALLKLCRAHISGDTGLMHAGLALDVPTVALFGPDDPKWTGPYPKQQRAIVIQAPQEARPKNFDRRKDDGVLMRAISVDAVAEALTRLL